MREKQIHPVNELCDFITKDCLHPELGLKYTVEQRKAIRTTISYMRRKLRKDFDDHVKWAFEAGKELGEGSMCYAKAQEIKKGHQYVKRMYYNK